MSYRHKETGEIKTKGEWTRIHAPNVSLPSAWNNSTLEYLQLEYVHSTPQPEPSSSTKVVVTDGIEKSTMEMTDGSKEEVWVEKWKEVDRFSDIKDADGKVTKTKADQDKEYQDQQDNKTVQEWRAKREPLLEEADWQINILLDAGSDASAWRTYRQKLRDITKQSISSITWPTKPS